MTYEASLTRMAEQKVQNVILFTLEPKTEWFTKERRPFVDTANEPVERTFPWSGGTLTSSITYPEIISIWEQSNLLSLVEHLYIFRRKAEVIAFLQSYQFLVPLLLEVYANVSEYFGPSPEVVLEVVSDPEAEYRELFALVRTNLSPTEALARLKRFDQEWWLDTSDRAQCMLNVDVEYI